MTKRMPVGGGRPAILDAVDLTVASGEAVAVVGRSGSGKSTLLSLLALFDRPDGGIYRLDGAEVSSATERVAGRIRSDVLGFVFQRFFLMKQLSAAQNVELPLLNGRSGIRARRRHALVDDALASVGLADLAGRRPAELSGGEQQRVAIARALVRGPRVVLADEPTGALDPATGAGIIELLTSIAKRGTAVVIVTHDHDYAARLDRVVHLTEGRVTCR